MCRWERKEDPSEYIFWICKAITAAFVVRSTCGYWKINASLARTIWIASGKGFRVRCQMVQAAMLQPLQKVRPHWSGVSQLIALAKLHLKNPQHLTSSSHSLKKPSQLTTHILPLPPHLMSTILPFLTYVHTAASPPL